jgi:tRNA-dihydrouridine synthase B
MGRPWFLRQVMAFLRSGEVLPDPPLAAQLAAMLDHYDAILTYHGTDRGVRVARKHLNRYCTTLLGAAETRVAINQEDDPRQVAALLRDFYAPYIDRAAA